MRFVNPLPFVADMDRARRFYCNVIGLKVVEDQGDFVRFVGGFALHDGAALHRKVFSRPPENTAFGRDNLVLYFESDDLDAAFAQIASKAPIIHPIEIQDWGGRVFRVYDPDGHIVEIGETDAA